MAEDLLSLLRMMETFALWELLAELVTATREIADEDGVGEMECHSLDGRTKDSLDLGIMCDSSPCFSHMPTDPFCSVIEFVSWHDEWQAPWPFADAVRWPTPSIALQSAPCRRTLRLFFFGMKEHTTKSDYHRDKE